MFRTKNYMLGETITAVIFSLGIITFFIITFLNVIYINEYTMIYLFSLLIILSGVIHSNLMILSDPDKIREICDERNVLIDLKATKITVFVIRWTLVLFWILGIPYNVLIELLILESFLAYHLAFKYIDKRN